MSAVNQSILNVEDTCRRDGRAHSTCPGKGNIPGAPPVGDGIGVIVAALKRRWREEKRKEEKSCRVKNRDKKKT